MSQVHTYPQTLEDRRVFRSQSPQEALYLQLVHVAEFFQLDTVIIANEEGQVVASSRGSGLGDALSVELARYSPALTDHRIRAAHGREATTRLTLALSSHDGILGLDDLQVHEFHAGHQRMFLITVGDDEAQMRELGIYRVIFGARRIWNQHISMAA